MLKGVNKQIVEINRTGDEYIEKAILILNPNIATEDKQQINKRASEFLTLANENKYIYDKKYKRIAIFLAVLSGCLLALLIAAIILL